MERLVIAPNRHGEPELCRFENGELFFKRCYARSFADTLSRAWALADAAQKAGAHLPWREAMRLAKAGL